MREIFKALILCGLLCAGAHAVPDPCKYLISTPAILWTMDKATGIPKGSRPAGAYFNVLDAAGDKVKRADGTVMNFSEQQTALTEMFSRMVTGCKPAPVITPPIVTPTPTPTPAPVPATYSATISWKIPTTRANGDALPITELAGYEIYYTTGTSTQVTIPVTGGALTSYGIKDLAPGTYYFAVAAVDTNGTKSALSQMVSISFP